jgi:hypothetical protein
MERLLRTLFMPYLLKNGLFGRSQFAYIPERGARDALAILVITWLMAVAKKRKTAVYCSDVSGAFDRVKLDRLTRKLTLKKIHPTIVAFLKSLRCRRAKVVVGGDASEEFSLENMVFQGTVLGPPLWNLFFEDAGEAIQEMHFEDIRYADDLNAYRLLPSTTPNSKVLEALKLCQAELHAWGDANQVEFDSGKESLHLISATEACGEDFKILGVEFDVMLTMRGAVEKLTTDAS